MRSFIHYVEGVRPPVYSKESLHAAVVEIIVKKGATVAIQQSKIASNNMFNLVTKRAYVKKGHDGVVDGILDHNNMKYQVVFGRLIVLEGLVSQLLQPKKEQYQDAGAKMIICPNTSSVIILNQCS